METKAPTRSPLRRVLLRILPIALAAILAWFYMPTAGPTAQRIAKLHSGMTLQEAQNVMGPPDESTTFSSTIDSVPISSETWVYRTGDKRLTLHFSKQRLTTFENNGF